MTTTMSLPTNPHYKPSPEGDELERLVAEKIAREEAEGREPTPKLEPAGEDGPPLKQFLDGFLQKMGVPPDLVSVPVDVKAEYAAAARELEAASRLGAFHMVCGTKFREEWDWKKCPPELTTAAAKAELKKVRDWQYGPRGLYVAGPTGHCKTRVLMKLVKRLIVDEKRKVLVLDGVAFSNLMTRAFGNPDDTEAILRDVCRVPVLIVDDLGKRWTPATEEGAFTVIDRRTANDRPFICTVNYSGADFISMQQARGELAGIRDVATPLVRRLGDYCEPVVL